MNHSRYEYARPGTDIHSNTAESFFAIVKRGLDGIYHSVSKKHLHRYMAEYEFRWNRRGLQDGPRTVAAIHSHGPSYRFPGDRDADAIAAAVRAAARALGEMLT